TPRSPPPEGRSARTGKSTPQPRPPRRRHQPATAAVRTVSLKPWSSSQLVREVVFERELHAEVVRTEPVAEVFALAPLQLAADHDVLHRRIQEVEDRVLTVLERVRRLPVAVVDVDARVTDRAGEHLIPGVV